MIALCPQSSHGQTKKVFLSRSSWKSLARTTDKGSSQVVKGVSLRRYAKFKCYCDTTTAKKTKAIEETSAAIEAAEAQLEDLRAQNTKLSQEVIHRSYLFLFPDFRQELLHSWIPSVRFVH